MFLNLILGKTKYYFINYETLLSKIKKFAVKQRIFFQFLNIFCEGKTNHFLLQLNCNNHSEIST